MLAGMELRHLRYFVAVAEEENVTRAAARLNVSQPSLSRQIRDLEDEIGVELFQRTAKSLRLTEAGRVFLSEARSILFKVDAAITVVRATVGDAAGEVRIGYAPTPTGVLLPRLLQAFEKEAPGVRVRLQELSSAEMMNGLRTRKLDAALMVENADAKRKGFIFDVLHHDRAGALIPLTHPLAKRRRLRPEDLLDERLAVYSRKEYPDYHDWLRAIFGTRTKTLRIAEECDGASSLITAVHAKGLVAVVAESIRPIAGTRAAFVPVASAPPIRVGIRYPENLQPESLTRRFVAIAKEISRK